MTIALVFYIGFHSLYLRRLPPPQMWSLAQKNRVLYEPAIISIIEEGFIKKPRETVVVAFWGKMATHMLLRMCSRQIITRQAGSKLRGGGVFVY